MLKNYLKIALRQLWNNKLFSALNIFGLATSMSVCLLLIMILTDQYGYDTFHEKGDQIFRVTSAKSMEQVPQKPNFATTALTVAEDLKEDYPFIKGIVRFLHAGPEVLIGEKKISTDVWAYFVDQDFLEVFSFGWVAGDQRTALLQPRSIVLTESSAKLFFPYSDPLNKDVELEGLGTFTVTGILPDPPVRSHIQFDYLISYATVEVFNAAERKNADIHDEYFEIWRGLVYVLLDESASQNQLKEALTTIAADYSIKDGKDKYLLQAQSLGDIYPSKELGNEIGHGTPSFILYFLMVLGLIVILSACFNYTSLSIAKALKRTKEIGVRKVLGASKRDVIKQIIGEAIIFSLVSLLVAVFLLEFLIPAFIGLDPFVAQMVHLERSPQLYILFIGFSLLIGLVAGLLPAITIAKLKPVQAIQKLSNIKLLARGSVQKILITIQFTFALLFILTVIIVLQQERHVLNADIGLNFQNIYNVKMEGEDYELFAQKVRQIKGVEEVSASSVILLTSVQAGGMISYNDRQDSLLIYKNQISANFLDNFEIEIIAGNNLPNTTTNTEQFVLVNELATKRMGFATPDLAIGQSIYFDSLHLSIVGVTNNFHQTNIWFDPVGPYLLRQNINNKRNANIRIDEANNIPETIAAVHAIWKEISITDKTMTGFFVDERVYYLSKFFKIGSKMIGFVGFLSILIACMGLLGIVIYTTETKMKEVGIRKILGASRGNIIWRLSKGFFVLLAISILIATPLTIAGANLWLQNFANRMAITPMLILSGISILLILGLVTVISQTFLAANASPIDSLHNE